MKKLLFLSVCLLALYIQLVPSDDAQALLNGRKVIIMTDDEHRKFLEEKLGMSGEDVLQLQAEQMKMLKKEPVADVDPAWLLQYVKENCSNLNERQLIDLGRMNEAFRKGVDTGKLMEKNGKKLNSSERRSVVFESIKKELQVIQQEHEEIRWENFKKAFAPYIALAGATALSIYLYKAYKRIKTIENKAGWQKWKHILFAK